MGPPGRLPHRHGDRVGGSQGRTAERDPPGIRRLGDRPDRGGGSDRGAVWSLTQGVRPGAMALETKPKEDGGAFSGYAEPQERPPFASYAAFSAILNAGLAGSLLAAKRSGRELPERIGPGDVLLIGTASHKVSRL